MNFFGNVIVFIKPRNNLKQFILLQKNDQNYCLRPERVIL